MEKVKMFFYNDIHPKLKKYIRHYWMTTGTLNERDSFKILPMDHIDVVIPIIGEYTHTINGEGVCVKNTFFHGMRDVPVELIQHGYVESVGITFEPWGFYPFVGKDLFEYKNSIIQLAEVNGSLASKISYIVSVYPRIDEDKFEKIIKAIESILLNWLEESDASLEMVGLVEEACKVEYASVDDIARHVGVTTRQLERIFKKYIGIGTKSFLSVKQFEDASRSVLYENMSLTDVAYDGDYYDQSHFSRSFKKFSKESPKQLRKGKHALKSRMDFK